MPKLTGNCLCGNVSFEADGQPIVMANCHCTDCQQTTGSPFATLVFLQETEVQVSGDTQSFEHKVDSGNTLTKKFCPNCGSQMFTTNSARPGLFGLRAGHINEKDEVKPQFNVYAGSKMGCTILDPDIPAFEKMPG